MWRLDLSDEDKKYYIQFAAEAKQEYQQQLIAYRATGTFQPSTRFAPLDNTRIWVRIDTHACALEREISSYPSAVFPRRPPELDEAYEERQLRSALKRKLRMRKEMDEDGNVQEGIDFEALLEEERRKRRQRRNEGDEKNKHTDTEEEEDSDI